MQLILDNLVAILVTGVILLGLQVNQSRSQHAGIEQVASSSFRAKTLIFGQWVERDILDLGANFGTNMYRFEEPDTSAVGNTTRWVFYSDDPDAAGGPVRVFKQYRLVETGTASYRDNQETYQLYQVRRDSVVVPYAADGTPPDVDDVDDDDWVQDIWSIGTLSFFRIDMVDRRGEVPRYESGAMAGEIDVTKADYIRVRFGVVPEFTLKPDNYIREMYWSKTLKVRPYWTPPPSLSQQS